MKLDRFAIGFAAGASAVILRATLVNAVDAVDIFGRPLLVPDSAEGADALVVLGAGVSGDNCVPNLSAMRGTIAAVHEYLGLAYYRMRGYS